MKIFKRKNNAKVYKIYCYREQVVQTRKFAELHAAERTVIDVRALGPLSKENVRVVVSFVSREQEATIYQAVLNEFGGYNIEIVGRSMFINKEENGFF